MNALVVQVKSKERWDDWTRRPYSTTGSTVVSVYGRCELPFAMKMHPDELDIDGSIDCGLSVTGWLCMAWRIGGLELA